MSLALLQPGVNRTAHLSNIDFTVFTRDAVYFQCLQFQVVLGRPKKAIYFSWREAHRLEVVPRQHLGIAQHNKYMSDATVELMKN
jgi:hypothetical protein